MMHPVVARVVFLSALGITATGAFLVWSSRQECVYSNRIDSEYGYANYLATIESLRERVVALAKPDELYVFPEFRTIYQHPADYYAYAMRAVRSTKLDLLEKKIVIYSMTRLPGGCYLSFVQNGYAGYRERALTLEEFTPMLTHAFGKREAFLDVAHYREAQDLIALMRQDSTLRASYSLEYVFQVAEEEK